MSPDEKLILSAWAHGHAGASRRLARRAWLVLHDLERTNPIEIGKAWGSPAEAQAWVLEFRAMGLVGLMDAPRSGRPATRGNAVAPIVEELERARDRIAKRAILRGFSRKERDAIWRANRRTGQVIERGHRTLDLDVPVPSALRDLEGVFVSPELVVIAALDRSDQMFDQMRGVWLAVPRAAAGPAKSLKLPRRDLLTTLSIRITADGGEIAKPATTLKKRASRSGLKSAASLLSRLVERLAEISDACRGQMEIVVLTNVDAGGLFLHFLALCRRHRLWTSRSDRARSSLKQMMPSAFEPGSLALTAQTALAQLLPNSSGEPLADLFDGIRRPRSQPFCWLREFDEAEESSDADWLFGDGIELDS